MLQTKMANCSFSFQPQAWKLLSSIPLDLAEESAQEQQLLTSYAFAGLRKRNLVKAEQAFVRNACFPLHFAEINTPDSQLKAFGYIEATPSSLPFQVPFFAHLGLVSSPITLAFFYRAGTLT